MKEHGEDDDVSFIMVVQGDRGLSHYFQYEGSQFHAYADEKDQFVVRIGRSVFTHNSITLDVSASTSTTPLSDLSLSVHGEIRFSNHTRWPVTLSSPGAMGWFGWMPLMECYHGVGSMDSDTEGSLVFSSSLDPLSNKTVSFNGGKGYMEKDWGVTFPSPYTWLQCNHFESSTHGTSSRPVSLFASVARIPAPKNLPFTFNGFIAGFYVHDTLYRFATYTGAWYGVIIIP